MTEYEVSYYYTSIVNIEKYDIMDYDEYTRIIDKLLDTIDIHYNDEYGDIYKLFEYHKKEPWNINSHNLEYYNNLQYELHDNKNYRLYKLLDWNYDYSVIFSIYNDDELITTVNDKYPLYIRRLFKTIENFYCFNECPSGSYHHYKYYYYNKYYFYIKCYHRKMQQVPFDIIYHGMKSLFDDYNDDKINALFQDIIRPSLIINFLEIIKNYYGEWENILSNRKKYQQLIDKAILILSIKNQGNYLGF